MLRPCCPGFLRKARWRLRVETHLSCSQGLSREYKSGPRIFPAKISSQAPVRLCCRAAEVEFPDPRSLPGSPSAAGPRQAQHNRKRSRQKPPRQKENTDPSRLRWLQGVGCGDLRLGVAAASRQQKRTEQNTPLAHLRSLAGPVPALPPVSYVPGAFLGLAVVTTLAHSRRRRGCSIREAPAAASPAAVARPGRRAAPSPPQRPSSP